MEILYSTAELDVVGLAQSDGQNLLMYYGIPKAGIPPAGLLRTANISAHPEALTACAAACLRERACQAFSLESGATSPSCTWVTSEVDRLEPRSDVLTYAKNSSAAAVLFSAQAAAGSDYTPVAAQTAFVEDGSGLANLTVPILTDQFPEMDESFAIQILRVNSSSWSNTSCIHAFRHNPYVLILKVSLLNLSVAERNLPTVGQPDKAVVTIGMNGDAFGVFLIYSLSPSAAEGGLYLEVLEEPSVVPLVIERRGGDLGRVTVEWRFVGGEATPDTDFTGTGGTLVFDGTEIKKIILLEGS